MKKKIILIGYSGHAYVVCDIFESKGQKVDAYFDLAEKKTNPFNLVYLGSERSSMAVEYLKNNNWFVAIGNNKLREGVLNTQMNRNTRRPLTIFHEKSIVSTKVIIGYGSMVGAGAIINALATIGNGVICNTGVIVEHECRIGDFVHIAPNAVLAGNVQVGARSFVGANTVVKEGVIIGDDVIIGAGSVIIRDLPSGSIVAGNPGRKIK